MVSEWPEVRLQDIVTKLGDGLHGTPKYSEDGAYFFINGNNLDKGQISLKPDTKRVSLAEFEKHKKTLNSRTLLVSINGTIGNIAYYKNEPVILGKSACYFNLHENVSRRFVRYILSGYPFRQYLESYSTGSTIKNVSLKMMREFSFPLPPLSEQRAIASVLGTLDDLIELNRETNEILEEMARALFKSWFVDFDPVRRNKDEGGRMKDENSATSSFIPHPSAFDPLFPDHFQDSELGQIPRGWEVGRLDQIASILMGLSPNGDSYNASGIGAPLINGPVEFGDYFPVKTKWTEAATRFCCEHDLIFCVRGSTTGRRVISDGKYGIGRGVCAMRAKDGFHGFLYQTINVGLDRMLEKTTGSVFPSLSAPDIKGFSVLKPSEGVLNAFERAVKPLTLSIQENHKESRDLATLRDTLLPKLLSGELSVPAAEELIAAAS